MKKICVFPEEFDPVIAQGPPSEESIKTGGTWTEEETNRHRLMRFDVEEMVADGSGPAGRWCIRMTKEEYLKTLS